MRIIDSYSSHNQEAGVKPCTGRVPLVTLSGQSGKEKRLRILRLVAQWKILLQILLITPRSVMKTSLVIRFAIALPDYHQWWDQHNQGAEVKLCINFGTTVKIKIRRFWTKRVVYTKVLKFWAKGAGEEMTAIRSKEIRQNTHGRPPT
jgi:hypothetical protein